MTSSERQEFWVDMNLPPALAEWFSSREGVRGTHFSQRGFDETPDRQVFMQARAAQAVIVSKDSDFPVLVRSLGVPPQVVWVRAGNVQTGSLLGLFALRFESIQRHLLAGDEVVVVES